MSLNLNKATRDELYEEARKLEIPGRSGMTKPALIEAITRKRLDENNDRDAVPAPVANIGEARVRRELAQHIAEDILTGDRPITMRRTVKAMREKKSRFYGPMYGGRGMGAKHYASRSNPTPADVRAVVPGTRMVGAL